MDFEYRYYFSEVPGRGRCIFASRDIRKGDVVLVEDAFVLAINKRHAEVSCSHCGVTCDSSGTVYQVSPDDPLRYCSEHCITIDYPVHQLELPAFAATTALAEVFGQETYRVLIRLAALRKKGGGAEDTEGAAAPRFPEVGSSVKRLEAAAGGVSEDTLRSLRNSARAFSAALSAVPMPLSADDVQHLALAVQCNAHNIKEVNGDPIGIGLFPATSMMNHSCAPNCAHSFIFNRSQPPRLVMRALRDVSQGEELCYSYVPLYQSTRQRLAQLSAAYSFVCSCARCEGTFTAALDDSVLEGNPSAEAKKALKGIDTCCALIRRASVSQKISLLKRLLGMLSNEEQAAALDPAHQSLLHAYVCIADTAYSLISTDTALIPIEGASDIGDLNLLSFSFATLAIGCISAFTGIESADIGRMAEVMAKSLPPLLRRRQMAGVDLKLDKIEEYFERVSIAALIRFIPSGSEHAITRYVGVVRLLILNLPACQANTGTEKKLHPLVRDLVALALSNYSAELDWSAEKTDRFIESVNIITEESDAAVMNMNDA